MDIGVMAQILSSLATFVVAAGILYQGREAPVRDYYQNVVQNLRAKGLTEGITLTSKYEDRKGESYETEWTINPLLLEGSGYSEYKGYEGQVQAVENQARALERTSEDIKGAVAQLQERASRDVES